MKEYMQNDKLYITLTHDDVRQLIVDKFFMDNTPADLYQINCYNAQIVIRLDDKDKR